MRLTRIAFVGAGIAAALSLAGCGGESPGDSPTPTTSAEASDSEVSQEHNNADTMFAQMMIVHHEGAIEMADLAVERTESAEVRGLSESISAAQGPEIQVMTSWLEAWGADTGPGDAMDHMGHGGMDMGGLSQEEAMDALDGASGSEFDRLYLELMIAHHEGAVQMSEMHLNTGQNPEALDLSQHMIDAQLEEIDTMQEMLLTIPD